MLHVKCQVSNVICQMSCVKCHVSNVMGHISCIYMTPMRDPFWLLQSRTLAPCIWPSSLRLTHTRACPQCNEPVPSRLVSTVAVRDLPALTGISNRKSFRCCGLVDDTPLLDKTDFSFSLQFTVYFQFK